MASVIATLIAFLALPAFSSIAAVASSPAAPYAYDSQHRTAAATHAHSERGPPAEYDRVATDNTVDRYSHGASVRPDETTPRAAFDYDYPVLVVRAACVATPAHERDRVDSGDLRPFSGASVAANTGPKALNAASRVSPWAGPSLSRLTRDGEVMYRVWGGGADKAGSWLTPINPISSAAARQGLALPAENAALYVSKVTLPAGVRVQVGTAGPAFGQPGGWAQMQLLERIPLSSFGKGVPLQ